MSKNTKSKPTTAKITRIKADAPIKEKVVAKEPILKPKTNRKKFVNNSIIKKILKPFKALGGYIKGSFLELRQVVWPNRKSTWAMTLAVIMYSALLILLVVILDSFFRWIIKLMIG